MTTKLTTRFCLRGGKSSSGMTLLEMMVAMFAGIIVAAAVMLTCIFVAASFVAVGNYSDLNKTSRNVLDNMSRNIRGASHYASTLSSTTLTMTNLPTIVGGKTNYPTFTYQWDSSKNQLLYISNGVSQVLLTNCDILSFQYYQRNVTTDFQFVPTTDPDEVKMVSVAWRCYKTVYGRKINTESVQTAQICVRN